MCIFVYWLSKYDLTFSTLLAVDKSALQKLNYAKFTEDFAQKNGKSNNLQII